ncbi:MAG: Hsp70 family protein [Myxococcota bacterium]
MALSSRYLIGIDLGTTHTVVAYADTKNAQGTPEIASFPIEQLVAPGEVAERAMFPSVRYHCAAGELAGGDRALPWAAGDADAPVLGELAHQLGAKVPGRLVASAKSWLSHGAVDRTAPILPWGAPDDVNKVSPVDAQASYLAHLRAAWDHRFPQNPMHTQEVVLTVPASFDEAARALTLQAAKSAGLKVRLVEEPQAAFYCWLDQHRDDLEDALGAVRLAVVVDVGGGTTDLTLIRVELRESGPRLTRIAVGDHLMLGGDNMDLLLAKTAEQDLGKTLGAARFTQLVQQCRAAKERLLAADAPEQVKVTVLGSGSKLIGGAQSVAVDRARVHELVLEGFFPGVEPSAQPQRRRGGIVEFGLPYVADAAVTRHVAAFLQAHEDLVREAMGTTDTRGTGDATAIPDAVLFNGGVFNSELLRERMVSVLGGWRSDAMTVLQSENPDLAVAKGAVAYGLARRGLGLRIGGGSPRSYFLIVDEKSQAKKRGVCLLPRGSEEGEEIPLQDKTFSLRLGRPVRFHLVATTQDVTHVRPGEVVEVDDADRYRDLPPIAAVLDDGDAEETEREVPVRLLSALTEVGTLEMSCLQADDPSQRWKLELQLRGTQREGLSAERVTQLHPRFAEATERVRQVYGKAKKGTQVAPRDVKRLRADLEKILGSRDGWQTPLLRELFGALLAGIKRRRRTADHERVWFNLVGYCLRPGFGYPLDEWRIKQLVSSVLPSGLQFVPEAQNWSEYWTLWRRLAGGLDDATQGKLLKEIEFYLEPPARKPKPRPKGPKKLGYDDMVRLAGALERVDAARKAQVGGWLVTRLDKHDENLQTWWSVGRLGARVPFYGSAHQVVPKHVVHQWLELALTFDWRETTEAAFAATLMARMSGDRERDLDATLRTQVADRLVMAGHPDSWVKMVLEVRTLEAADERRIFGDSLPPGLRLLD